MDASIFSVSQRVQVYSTNVGGYTSALSEGSGASFGCGSARGFLRHFCSHYHVFVLVLRGHVTARPDRCFSDYLLLDAP